MQRASPRLTVKYFHLFIYVVTRHRLQGKALSYNGFAFREARDSGEGKSDVCVLMVATAKVVDLATGLVMTDDNNTGMTRCCLLCSFRGYDLVSYFNMWLLSLSRGISDDPTSSTPSLAIELVGDRFLRRMVRILAATAIRESVLSEDQRDVDVLLKICHSGDR